MRFIGNCTLVIILSTVFSSVALAQSTVEITQNATKKVQEIQALHSGVLGLSEDAQQTDDIALIQCVNSKKTSITALKDITEGALRAVRQANSIEKAAYESRKIDIALPRVRQFSKEAQKCITGTASDSAAGVQTQISVMLDTNGNNFSDESSPSVSSADSYAFDSSGTSLDSGADSINPPPDTSPY